MHRSGRSAQGRNNIPPMTDAQLDNAIVRHAQSASRWKTVCFSALLVAALSAASMGVAAHQTSASAAAPAASATATMQSQAQPIVSPSPTPTITPTPTLAQVIPAAFANLSQLDGSSTLASAGVELNEMQRSQLMERIEDFRAQGYQASFVVVDMRTGAAIASYGGMPMYTASSIKAPYIVSLAQTGAVDINAVATSVVVDMRTGAAIASYGGMPMYTASSIKAPYIVSLAQTGAVDINAVATSATADAAGLNQLITQTLQVSDNDTYEALYKRFGAAPTGAVDINAVATSATADAAGLNQLITQTLQVSDNDTYEALYKRFGAAPTMQWLAGTGATTGLNGYYGDVTAIDLARMWVNSYDAAGLNQLITQTLQVSDNDTYEALYKRFGAAPTMQWLAGTGATTGLNGYYGDVTAIDLARMWVNSYDYLFGASADAADAQGRTWLAQQMRSSLNSSIAAVHGEGEIVASKAGWIYGEGNLYAYNDAGIVIPAGSMQLSEKPQGYVLAMLTNACARDDLLTALALFGASADAADAQGRTWLAQQMRSSLNSSIAAVHGEGEIVASKAGWIYGEGNLYAYNDAGIVIPAGSMQLSEKPPGYVLAMLTNACARDDLLTALAQTVDDALRAARTRDPCRRLAGAMNGKTQLHNHYNGL